MKRPAFQFYPADWRKDVALRSCSIAARGLWIDLLCIAHDCEPYGHLVVNGKPMTAAQIAGQVGLTAQQCKRLMDELVANGVVRVTDDGVFYSKRMVDDERLRNLRAEGGKAGSEHGIKGAAHGMKGGRPTEPRGEARGDKEPPLQPASEPPPSSSSSSSSSTSPPSGEKTKATLRAADLVALGVDERTAADFLAVRKAKRQPLTRTALDGIVAEAAIARLSLRDALRESTTRGWAGFRAKWLVNDEQRGAARLTGREAAAAAVWGVPALGEVVNG